MFNKRMFADMKRAGFNVGLSKSKLAQAMLEILIQLPPGTTNLKDTIVAHLGLLGRMSSTRDINAAWNEVKRKAVREYPDRFVLDERKALHWNDGSYRPPDKKISSANFQKLNDLADAEGCTVNQVVSRLIKHYAKRPA